MKLDWFNLTKRFLGAPRLTKATNTSNITSASNNPIEGPDLTVHSVHPADVSSGIKLVYEGRGRTHCPNCTTTFGFKLRLMKAFKKDDNSSGPITNSVPGFPFPAPHHKTNKA